MAFLIKDRVRETATTTGTGSLTLLGAVAGYQAFSTVCSVGDTFWYAIVLSATSWETGVGTYSGTNTLARTTVLESSNAGAAVNFGSGVKDVFIGFPSSKMAGLFDSAGAADQVRWNTVQTLTSGQIAQVLSNLGITGVPTGGFSTGDVKFTIKTAAESGWVLMNDGTIGSAVSGATYAAADAQNLFLLLWNNLSNTWAPVTGGRGANAATDWSNNRKIELPKALGRALAASGSGSGLSSRILGQTLGAESHTLLLAETPSHTITGSTGGQNSDHTHSASNIIQTNGPFGERLAGASGGGIPVGVPNLTTGGTNNDHGHPFSVANGGGDLAHNNMQPSLFLNVLIKL